MNILVTTYDLPPEEREEAYEEYVRTMGLPVLMRQQGLVEFRLYENPLRTSPQIMMHCEFDSPASLNRYLESEAYREFMYRLRGLGCQNITARLWKPGQPPSLRPSGI